MNDHSNCDHDHSHDHPAYADKETYIAPEKVGRNDACPCGSGKKYKKCCLK